MPMRIDNIVLVGAGGHCKSVIDSIVSVHPDAKIKITDKYISKGGLLLGYEIIGNDDMLDACYKMGYRQAAISIGSVKSTFVRRNVLQKCKRIGFEFPVIRDASATVAASASICMGVYIGKKASINSDACIGEHAIINTGAIIEHDCYIGSFAHVAVGAVVCGGCDVGNDVFIGANATVIQGVKIGMNSIIGAGSLILADVPNNTTVTGVWGGRLSGWHRCRVPRKAAA